MTLEEAIQKFDDKFEELEEIIKKLQEMDAHREQEIEELRDKYTESYFYGKML